MNLPINRHDYRMLLKPCGKHKANVRVLVVGEILPALSRVQVKIADAPWFDAFEVPVEDLGPMHGLPGFVVEEWFCRGTSYRIEIDVGQKTWRAYRGEGSGWIEIHARTQAEGRYFPLHVGKRAQALLSLVAASVSDKGKSGD